MGSTNVISTAVDDCARAFLSLAGSLEKPNRFAEQVAAEVILDEFDRFKLWAGNISAHRKGRRSLDNRLRDATRLKEETVGLLTFLSDALKKALAIVKGEITPWDEETYSDSESEHSDDNASNPDLQGDTEFKQLYSSIKTAITSLMRISMAIREPALNSQSRSIDKSHFQQHDIQHVQNKFPNAARYLTERMGHAISSRRQYLAYRETHHEKLTKGIDKLGLEAARTEFTTNSTEATRLQRTGSFNTLDDDEDDTASQTSYATSVNATVRAPKLPKEAREKEYYDCPFCFALIAIHTTAAWKRHVYQDLHPYCCTFENCTTADRLYDSRHAWFAHELEAHHSSFQCVQGCSEAFQTESDFANHIKSRHEDLAAPAVYSALRRASTKTPGLDEEATCKLCARRMTLRKMQRHLGHHHEQLALFALPANLDDIEDDLDEEDQDSVVKAGEDREGEGEDLTDTSDTSEIEELIQRNDDLHEDPVTIFSDQHGEFQYHTASGHQGLEGQRTYNSNESFHDFDDDEDEDSDDDSPGPFEKSRQVHLTRGNHAKNQAKAQEESDDQAFQKSPVNDEDTAGELKEAAEEVSDDSVVGNAPTSVSETDQATRDGVEREMENAQHWSRAEYQARKRAQEVADVEEDPFEHDLLLGVDERVTEEVPVKREERVAQQAAVDAYNQRKAKEEKEAAEERDRIIHEYEYNRVLDAEVTKRKLHELRIAEARNRKQRQKYEEEYGVFLSKQKETEDAAMERRLAEDRDLDVAMRKRLEEFGFKEDQIQNMFQPEQTKTGGKGKAAISTNDLPSTAPQPTYIKIHKDHLGIETLQYYDIPYEFDKDPDYIIVLREIDEREVDVLLEHTRRLRRAMKRTLIDAERSGNRTSEESDSEVQRSESQQPQKPRMPSVSEVDRQQSYEPWDLNLSNDHSESEIAVKLPPFDRSLNSFPADRATKIPVYTGNSDNENEKNNALERSSAAENQSSDVEEIPITETNWREDFEARDSRETSRKGFHAMTKYPTPKYKAGDHVHMDVVKNGQRVKSRFTIRQARRNNRGNFEYTLDNLDNSLTGLLHRDGAGVRERDLKPSM